MPRPPHTISPHGHSSPSPGMSPGPHMSPSQAMPRQGSPQPGGNGPMGNMIMGMRPPMTSEQMMQLRMQGGRFMRPAGPGGHVMRMPYQQQSQVPRQMIMRGAVPNQGIAGSPVRPNGGAVGSPAGQAIVSPQHSVSYGSPGQVVQPGASPMRRPSGNSAASPAMDRPITPR